MNLSKKQKIELYNIIFPKSIEDDDDIKANDITDILNNKETFIIKWDKIKQIVKFFKNNNIPF